MSQKTLNLFPKNERSRLKTLTKIEAQARARGFKCIAGIDEAGRGPLAGPVVAAACIIPDGLYFSGINDSKLLLPKVREDLYDRLANSKDVHFGVGVVEHFDIDRINILQATLQAMRDAIQDLPIQPDCLLFDGKNTVLENIYSEAIIKGDTLSQTIAAASIIAKVRRDQIMLEYHRQYPDYGFDRHKGYATEKHRQALAKFGPCPIHRRTFIH